MLTAAANGDLAGLEQLLAEDVVAWADGGGAGAARRPVVGRDKVLRYLLGLNERPDVARSLVTIAEINGAPAAVFHDGGELIAIAALEVVDDMVSVVRLMVNPAKLAYAARQLA